MPPASRETNPAGARGRDRAAWALAAGSAAVYLASRLFRIEDFPIYFFCDEAVHWVRFKAMMENGWHAVDAPGELLPAFFKNGGMLNLSLSVYVQGFVNLLTSPSVTAVRATSAIASLTAGFALALTLRRAFALREWWSAMLFSAVLPCWFLHSRTGFETVLMVTGYCWFVYFYLRYRGDGPRWIFPAAAAGAVTFYAYAPGQGVIAVTALLLFICDFRYHWQNRRIVAGSLGFAVLLLVPYLRFRWQHPEMLSGHLKTLGSYLVQDLPLSEKTRLFAQNYLAGLSPRFWFEPGYDGAVRHAVPFQAHLPLLLLPFALTGFVLCILKWKSAPHRLVVIAAVAAPFSSAFVAPMVTRMLACVVPFVLATALGFDTLLSRVRAETVRSVARVTSFGLLCLATLGLTRVALSEGRAFPDDYGLYGVQWGAQKLFREVIPPYVKTNPGANVFISHASFNSPDVFPDFFGWKNERRVSFAILEDYLAGVVLPEAKDLVLLTAPEYRALRLRPEIDRFEVLERVDLPNQAPGFYLGHLQLNADFVARMSGGGGRKGLPAWERILVGREGASVSTGGVEQGRVSSLAAEGRALVGGEGEAINVNLFFDGPTELQSIEAEADAGQVVTIWATRPKQNPATLQLVRGAGKVQASLSGVSLNGIRVEVAARTGVVAHLRRLQLNPKAE